MSLEKKPVGKREFCFNQNGKYAYFKDKTKQEHFETFFFSPESKIFDEGIFSA